MAAQGLFSLGLRAEHSDRHHFAYTASFLGHKVNLLDGVGGTGTDALSYVGQGDAVLAISLAPYSRQVLEIARKASLRGVAVVGITNSPCRRWPALAQESIIVTANSRSFVQSIASALAAVDILVDRWGADVEKTIKSTEALLADFDVYLRPPA